MGKRIKKSIPIKLSWGKPKGEADNSVEPLAAAWRLGEK
jgi:hypothetical protein